MPDTFQRLAEALAGRYRIERELGAGGMATVYLAFDVKHHRKIAVKVLRPELAAALGGDRFTREIETAAQFQHPHVLPLLDSGERCSGAEAAPQHGRDTRTADRGPKPRACGRQSPGAREKCRGSTQGWPRTR